jgi:hypothetical protein
LRYGEVSFRNVFTAKVGIYFWNCLVPGVWKRAFISC